MVRTAEELLIPLDPIRALPRAIATRHKREKRICFREVVDAVMRSLTLIYCCAVPAVRERWLLSKCPRRFDGEPPDIH